MPNILASCLDLSAMDQLSRVDSPMHQIDPRAKIITALVMIIVTVSFESHEVSALLPLFAFPAFVASIGRIPTGFIFSRLLPALPFIMLVGIFNPLLDQETALYVGGWAISGGWLSFFSIFTRSLLTLGTCLVLLAVTGLPAIAAGLAQLKIPRAFIIQLIFLYRYIFILGEEGGKMTRARAQRSFYGRGRSLKTTASLLGSLMLRTLDRAERIYHAMNARGFDGEIKLRRLLRFCLTDTIFISAWCAFFIAARRWNLPSLLGELVDGTGL